MIMKRTPIAKTFAITVAAALALGIAPKAKADGPGCSKASLNGTFAYTSTGFNTAPPAPVGPFAEVGTQTFDGKGNTTGAATLNANGTVVLQVTFKGTYTVNPDCTGTFALQVTFPPASGVGTIPVPVFFVIDGIGNEFQALETVMGAVITRIGRKILLLPERP
jgi:hypothetical protein